MAKRKVRAKDAQGRERCASREVQLRKSKARSNQLSSLALRDKYLAYFVAPPRTPNEIRILDLSDGSGITFTSHT